MAFVKKTWKDRIAEFPTRRRLTKSNGDSELVTVAREEGTLSQEGDAFSAENMNDLENRIDAEFTVVNSNLNLLLKSENFTVYGTSETYISKNVDVTLDGYTLLGVIGSSGSTVTMNVKSSIIAENLITVQAYDNGASMASAVVTVTCLYVKNL